jgi:farnesyl-diphosphate farnesyltransferase
MAGFARDHAAARPDRLESLATIDDLDRYCWYVAGTVGHLLTELFRLHDPHIDAARHARLKQLATGFGLGLQLVNIIKDVADDRQRGWSYVPAALCRAHGLEPDHLLDPARTAQATAVMAELVAHARANLDQALDYCCTLPRSAWRLRLFCLTPHYFAVQTLALAERDPRLLDPAHKVKITRGQVRSTILLSHVVAPSNTLVRAYHRRLCGTGR